MIKSYLKVALRSFQRNRLVSFINIFGLGLSMSIGLIVMIRLQDALGYDRFHKKADKVYRIISSYGKKTGEEWKLASTPLPLYQKLQTGFSSVEKVALVYPAFSGKATSAGKEIYLSGAFAEPGFFQVFGFTLAAGDAATALQKPNTVVINKNTAEKFFGQQDAIGKVFTLEDGTSLMVSGILNDPPGKSHLDYEVYVSYASVPALEKNKILPDRMDKWFAFNAGYTYVLLKEGSTENILRNDLKSISAELNKQNNEGMSAFSTQSLLKITPGSESLGNERSGASWNKFYFEIGVAFKF